MDNAETAYLPTGDYCRLQIFLPRLSFPFSLQILENVLAIFGNIFENGQKMIENDGMTFE